MLVTPLSGSTKHKFPVFASILVLSVSFPLCAQTWLEGIFVSVSGQYYMLPNLAKAISPELADQYGVSGAIRPRPGFRAGAGYEWKKWSFGLESGYTYIKGDNPIVTDISIVPILVKAGYSFFPISSYEYFSLTPTAALGRVFAQADHYIDVIDMLLEKSTHSKNTGFMAQLGVRAGWNPIRQQGRALEVFAGLSIDGIIETGGLIPLPQIELGVIVRPFKFKFKARSVPVEEKIIEEELIVEEPEEIDKPVEEELFIEEEPEEIEPPEPVLYTWRALFPPNGTTATAEGRAVLDEAGAFIAEAIAKAAVKETIVEATEETAVEPAEEIAEEPEKIIEWEYKIIIKGYAAPFVSVPGQREVSRRRALYCASYLKEKYGIPEEYITVGWHGADALPENTEETAHSQRRSVEILFEMSPLKEQGYEK